MSSDDESTKAPVSAANEFAVHQGKNMSTNVVALTGRAKWVTVGTTSPVVVRTKQAAYRLASWLVILAESAELPDEEGAHDFDTIFEAVEASRM